MQSPRSTAALFDEEYLPLRSKLLEVAAALDRLGRASPAGAATAHDDPRWARIHAAISTLLLPENDRAEQIQLLFSRPYEENWRQELQRAGSR